MKFLSLPPSSRELMYASFMLLLQYSTAAIYYLLGLENEAFTHPVGFVLRILTGLFVAYPILVFYRYLRSKQIWGYGWLTFGLLIVLSFVLSLFLDALSMDQTWYLSIVLIISILSCAVACMAFLRGFEFFKEDYLLQSLLIFMLLQGGASIMSLVGGEKFSESLILQLFGGSFEFIFSVLFAVFLYRSAKKVASLARDKPQLQLESA